jgi:outer membrane protein
MNTRLCIRSILLATSLAAAPLGVAPLAGSADLGSIYQQALKNDPQIREAEANRLAARESKPQALSALLPQLTAGAGYDDSKSDGTSPFGPQGQPGDFERQGERNSWDVTLRQSVFRWQNWAALKRADAESAQAEAD